MMTKKILKYLLYSFLGILILLISFGFIVNYFYKDQAIAVITSEINKRLKTKIDVHHISFSVFSHFPQASVQFNNILIYSPPALNKSDFSHQASCDTLLYAKQLSFGFNLFDLLQKKYVFERIFVSGGKLSVFVDKVGHSNLDIMASSPNTQASPLQLNLNNIVLNDMMVSVRNATNDFLVNATVYDAKLSGNFYDSDYQFDIKSNLLLNELSEESVSFIDYRNITLQTTLSYRKHIFTIANGQLQIDQLPFIVSGTIATSPETILHLKLKGNNINIKTLLSLLPPTWQKKLSDYKSNGILAINSAIDGMVNYKTLPSITADFSIKKGSITYQPENACLKNIDLSGHFSNGAKRSAQSTQITIDTFYAAINQSSIRGYFKLQNLTAPSFNTHFDVQAALQSWNQFLSLDSVETLSGQVTGHLALSGTLKNIDSLTAETFKTLKNNSRFTLKDGILKLKNNPDIYTHINGDIHFVGNDAVIDSLRFGMNQQPISLSGRIYHYLSLLSNQHRLLKSNLTVSTSYLNVTEFLKKFSSNGSKSSDNALDLNTQFQLHIDTLDYNKLHITKLSASGLLLKNAIHIEQYSFQALEGETVGSLDFSDTPTEKTLQISSYLSHINICNLFSVFDNFGQSFITNKQLNGYATTNVSFASALDNSYRLIPESIISNAQITIKEGELKHFEPMQKLSKFTKLNDLSDVHFKTLSNEIFIEKSHIIIPEMTLSANEFSIDMSGTHQFTGQYEYHLHLLLSQLLGNKTDVTEFGTLEPNTNKTSLYLILTGDSDQSKIKYDTKATGQHIKNRLKEEKETLKQILKEEFGRKKNKKKKKILKSTKEETEGGWIIK